jgi:predicted esterase
LQRYQDSVFAEVQRSTVTYYQKSGEELRVDVFQPKDDKATDRPLLLYVHGGGFAGGQRDHPNHVRFCENLAKRGYVTATMSYTLVMKGKSFSCDRPAPEKIQTFLLTARDISRATQFFISKSKDYGIDPSKIIILGSSAGAEAVMHAAYWKETFKDDSVQILPSEFSYAGVVSMAGAITNINWITKETAIPTQLFHGTCDNLVPYGYAPHHYCQAQQPGYLMLYGGYAIAERLVEVGESYHLITGCYGWHEWNDKPIKEFQDEIAAFAYRSMFREETFQLHEIYESGDRTCESYNSYHFCE